jgi:hypothetical protein
MLVSGPRIAVSVEICGNRPTPIDEYLGGKLLADLGDGFREPMGLREALARYEQSEETPALRTAFQHFGDETDGHTTALHQNPASLPLKLVLLCGPLKSSVWPSLANESTRNALRIGQRVRAPSAMQ